MRNATVAFLVVLTAVGASCGVDDATSTGGGVRAPAATLDKDAIATTVTTEQPATDQRLIDRCLDYVKFAAFVGDIEAQHMWADAGQTDEGVRMLCQELVVADRAAVETMSAKMDEAEAAIEASSSATPASSPAVPPPAHLIEGCVRLTNWRLVTGDSVDEALAVAAKEGASQLTEACYNLAQVDPARAASMTDEMARINRFLEEASRPTTTPAPPPPAPPPPPQAQPPAPASDCDPNYTGCVPIASDVDCRGGSGNGPAYTGPVQVIGRDIYDLDRDHDGWACE